MLEKHTSETQVRANPNALFGYSIQLWSLMKEPQQRIGFHGHPKQWREQKWEGPLSP